MSAHRLEYIRRLNKFVEAYAQMCADKGDMDKARRVMSLSIPEWL